MLRTVFSKFNCFKVNFCTQNKIKTTLQDWEYVKQINDSLKNNSINEAFNKLIQSHLNNEILDIQTYYSIYRKIQQNDTPITYKQLLYKLYRQHFQPNFLMVDLIKSISRTKDLKLKNNLKKDLKNLYLFYPQKNFQYLKEQLKDKLKSESNEKNVNQKIQNPIPFQNYPQNGQKYSIRQKKKSKIQSNNKSQPILDPKIKQIATNQLHTFLHNHILENGKVVIHDVELFYDDDLDAPELIQNDEGNQPTMDEQLQKMKTIDDEYESFGNLENFIGFNRIKIGKIQLFKNDN